MAFSHVPGFLDVRQTLTRTGYILLERPHLWISLSDFLLRWQTIFGAPFDAPSVGMDDARAYMYHLRAIGFVSLWESDSETLFIQMQAHLVQLLSTTQPVHQ